MTSHGSGSTQYQKDTGNIDCRNPNYSGPSFRVVNSSITIRMEGIPFLEEYEYLKGFCEQAQRKFIRMFFHTLNKMGKRLEEAWEEKCKAREKELKKLLARIMLADPHLELTFVYLNGGREMKKAVSIADLRYCPDHFSIVGVGDDEIVDVYINECVPKIYGPLFVAMVKVATVIKELGDGEDSIRRGLEDLAMTLIERAGLHNEVNPDPDHWEAQELSTLKLLTNPPTREEDTFCMTVFAEVLKDIHEGTLPYVKDMHRALKATESYRKSQFSDNDYYYSMKSDPAIIPGLKSKASLVKSILEIDPDRGCPFDIKVGYNSHYNLRHPEGAKYPRIVTIHIPNKGKYKSRAIHMALSAIQDRCCYIHNRIKAVLDRLATDCTRNQRIGKLFAKEISSPSYRSRLNGFTSVLAYDWSNATDKMWQWFQEQCLLLVFDPEVVDYWHHLSTTEKVFRHKKGYQTIYVQENGQPQGLLGSFDAFAFAHHIIMLMTMKASGLEQYESKDFYRVLGDDSVISSIEVDPTNKVGNNYVRICAWANMDIERHKSTEILCDEPIALVDFAKTQYLDGREFSPIPTRVANRLAETKKVSRGYYAFAAALWQGMNGFFKPSWFRKLVDYYYPDDKDNKLVWELIESGALPAFREAGFNKDLDSISDQLLVMIVAYAASHVKSTVLNSLLEDKVREDFDQVNSAMKHDALSSMVPKYLQGFVDQIEDLDHKFLKAVQSNLDKEDLIREIFSCTEDQAQVVAAVLAIKEEEVQYIRTVFDILRVVKRDPSNVRYYRDEILDIAESGTAFLDRLNYRSVWKRKAQESMVIGQSLEMYREIMAQDTIPA